VVVTGLGIPLAGHRCGLVSGVVPVLVAAVLAAAASATAAPVESGEVVPFRGVAGVELGMSRAAVVAAVGRPLRETRGGVMVYSDEHILDVYLTRRGPLGRVRQVVAAGPGFCAKDVPGACSTARNSVIAMRRAYPRRFRRVVDVTQDTIWWWCGRVRGRAISTSFNTDPRRQAILTWYIVDHGTRCPALAQVRGG